MFYLTVGIPGPGSSNRFETFIGRSMLSVGLKTAMFIIGIMAENIVCPDSIKKFGNSGIKISQNHRLKTSHSL
jgi:hypothetical protein